MWSPTHCSVTVQRARGLLTKGKNGTNNCFVTIALGKEKYQTSVKDKAEPSVNWNEECELKIPDQGNRAELTLTCLHRNNLGIDEFLGQATLPLNEMDVYDRPRAKWFKLESKPGKEKKNKERGELEVRIAFVVKSGSLNDLSKKDKHKSSIGQLASSVGGSLLSIGHGEKRKSIKKLAGSLSSKLHIRSKKKQQTDGGDDNSSFSGSFASLGTPTSSTGGRRRGQGQRAGEADPGVISEDEDEFVFDNLSHKSSGSSLNIQRNSGGGGLQAPLANFAPRNPSPLLNNGGGGAKSNGGKLDSGNLHEDETMSLDNVKEMAQLELDFSVRAPQQQQQQQQYNNQMTPPQPSPPSKPPRQKEEQLSPPPSPPKDKQQQQSKDEWASKLYLDLDARNSDSLKRRSWESRVPLPSTIEESSSPPPQTRLSTSSASSSSSSSSSSSEAEETAPKPPVLAPTTSLFSPVLEQRNFEDLNSSFAQYELKNSTAIYGDEENTEEDFEKDMVLVEPPLPKPQPRVLSNNTQLVKDQQKAEREENEKAAQLRAAEDARLEEELRLNEQRLRDEEDALQRELEEQKNLKRRQEDQRLLSFAMQQQQPQQQQQQQQQQKQISQTIEEPPLTSAPVVHQMETNFILTPEQSPKEELGGGVIGGGLAINGRGEKQRLGKFKYGHKRDKHNNDSESNSPSPKSTERIIIGHEKSGGSHAERRSEISAQLAKKYEGKSREELMLIANGMENEALLQRQRVKELEDYLDNLLLRVMETHPKILQNPYSRTTSAKSYKNYINMNDFLNG